MEWFKNLFGQKTPPAKMAKDRLLLALSYDRVNCHPETLEMLKNDILNVLRKYMEIDDSELDIQVTQTVNDRNEQVPALFANIPIKNMRKKN